MSGGPVHAHRRGSKWAERIGALFAVVCALLAAGVTVVWIANHSNGPTYAAMTFGADEEYRAPRDRGLLVVGNGVYVMADQRRGTPPPGPFIPYWVVIAAAGLWPAWYVPRLVGEHRRRRREARGLCWRCGYDLRATPHRCPECGASPRGGSDCSVPSLSTPRGSTLDPAALMEFDRRTIQR
jgi:hypothetical protein